MMSDFEKMDVILRNDTVNSIERELSNVLGKSGSHCDNESNKQSGENDSHENDFGHYVHENIIARQDRFQETMKTFTSEYNMRQSLEMDSMMSMMHSQIYRAISATIAERVLPEIQNVVSSMSSAGNHDTEASLAPNSQENTEKNNGFNSKITKITHGPPVILETTGTIFLTSSLKKISMRNRKMEIVTIFLRFL